MNPGACTAVHKPALYSLSIHSLSALLNTVAKGSQLLSQHIIGSVGIDDGLRLLKRKLSLLVHISLVGMNRSHFCQEQIVAP